MLAAHNASPTKSTLTQQLEQSEGERTPRSTLNPSLGTPKPRSLSDAPKPALSPSPAFREPQRRVSKDDFSLTAPSTPSRPSLHIRGLSLHVPQRDAPENLASVVYPKVPLSPKLDQSQIYGLSPSSMLPRRSRGMDYTRACTNLHHSTLAMTSPDASPITGRGIQIPARKSFSNTVLDSPSNTANSLWSLSGDRTTLSSSVSSVNMLDSESDSDESSDDMAIDREMDDPVLNTPAASKMNGLNQALAVNSPGLEWLNNQPSPAQASLMSFQSTRMSFRRNRLRKGKSHHSSSGSLSMNSSKPSPGPLSPAVLKSVENNGSYFGAGLTKQQVQSRRESLSLGTNDLHLSDSEENSSGKPTAAHSLSDMDTEGPRGVIRRAVNRRSNLLPKSKNFARIRAALFEEAAPIESEARREAQVIRQVHENDPTISQSQTTSPVLQAKSPFTTEPIEDSIEDMAMDLQKSLPADSFSRQAEKNSAGLGFWTGFDNRYRTPPPGLIARESSSAISDEAMDTPGSSLADNPALKHFNRDRSRSRSSTPVPSNPPTAGDVARRVNNKRRRENDFDSAFIKRRAVSPGLSVHSSPVVPQSPVLTSDKSWGKVPPKANGQEHRSNSAGSINGAKKVGLQGMTETNEGIMSMSID